MYDIRQFKPSLYLLLLLGISGYALASESLGLCVVGVAGVGLNAWLVWLGRFRPLPRIIANAVALAAVLYILYEQKTSGQTLVLVVGQFLVLLQLVKLWEQRANRDYAQLLVLSLLLMVAASITTASLWFGLMLIGYLFLSLYCCLLFHLKVETDAAKAALPVPPEKLDPTTLRQDQRYLSSSMRRLLALVSSVSIACAVIIFLFFPRGSGAGILGPLQIRGSAPLTGFSEQVNFQDVARISQNHDKVAFVQVWHNEQPIEGTTTLLLRGLTLDSYQRAHGMGGGWEWLRSVPAEERGLAPPEKFTPLPNSPEPTRDLWRQHFTLYPTRTSVLFAMAGPVQFKPAYPLRIRYSPADGAIETSEPLNEKLNYEIISTNSLGPGEDWSTAPAGAMLRLEFPRIFDFARRPEVCGANEAGSLGDQRVKQRDVGPLDEQIAANIERYLRTHFSYTLDLTDEKSLRGRDPLEAFLYEWKRGHCEYFAGAMTLMCQSLGMQARLVIGFKSAPDEYNSLNHSYTVYQSDAHAWVEVKTPDGWKSCDPTSSRDYAGSGEWAGWMTRGRHLLEYLEYTYANAVIAYDSQNRDSIIGSIEAGLSHSASRSSSLLHWINDFLNQSRTFWNVSSLVLTVILLLMIGSVAAACAWFLWERWRLRKRAQRIGLESLPDAEQRRLARQLGFYDELLRLLARERIARPAHYTPMEFSRSLSFLPADAYNAVQRLTTLFYRVRYGGKELPPTRRRRLDHVLQRLSEELSR